MADVRLGLNEANGRLPEICLRCGEPATTTTTKKMQWCPPWVTVLIFTGLIPYVIVASILTKTATIQAPLCAQHRGHWFYRQLAIWGSFFFFGFICVAIFVGTESMPQPLQDDVFPFACLGGTLVFVTWMVIVAVCQNWVIRTKEITDEDITLAGVSDAFIEALEEARAERRARKRGRATEWRDEDDEEPEPSPRKKTPPSDAFEK